MNKPAPIVLAVDTNDLEIAKAWVSATDGVISVVKLGLEFYTTFGNEGIKAIADSCNTDIFLDLKLHDIPNTVKKSAGVVDHLHPRFLTVHASGGAAMVAAAVSAVSSTSITAVTVLTSLADSDLVELGFATSSLETAVAMARVATEAGATSIVCSPLEIAAIRAVIPQNVSIITPGVRPADELGADDQVRTMTPKAAISLGANLVVIGRPITQSWNLGAEAMRDRAAHIASELI